MHEAIKILIADDSEVIRTRLIDILSKIEGIVVIGEAVTLEEVFIVVENMKPDILILDIRMADGDGILALENIKKGENPPMVAMFTNYPYLQYRKKCFDLGADFYFYKALEFQKLIALLNKLVKSSSKRLDLNS